MTKERIPYRDGDEVVPCTCRDDCPSDCKGECGCKACKLAYQDHLSADYD
jgi:hypothetical protein